MNHCFNNYRVRYYTDLTIGFVVYNIHDSVHLLCFNFHSKQEHGRVYACGSILQTDGPCIGQATTGDDRTFLVLPAEMAQ